MHWLDLTLATAPENLALDEALLLAAEQGSSGEVLRIWECTEPAVILGAGCCLADDVNVAACHTDGVAILRRASGGGTVLLGPGCLAFTLVLAYDRAPELKHIGPSYRYILERVCEVLALPGLKPTGISDLALGDRKVSGNSQQRKRDYLLHHGTLLYNFDPAAADRYLRMPARQPDYRQSRTNPDFLTNIPLTRAQIVTRLRQAFAAEIDLEDWPAEMVKQLVAAKYGLEEWTRRR